MHTNHINQNTRQKVLEQKKNITCCHQEVIIDSWMINIMYSAC